MLNVEYNSWDIKELMTRALEKLPTDQLYANEEGKIWVTSGKRVQINFRGHRLLEFYLFVAKCFL